MLHILLLILKIMGFFLAALLAVMLSALICVLFVPIRYRVEAGGKLEGDRPLYASVKVSWLLHIINVAFAYPEAAYVKVRVFCFTVFDSSGKKKRKAKDAGEKKPLPDEADMEGKEKKEEKREAAGENGTEKQKTEKEGPVQITVEEKDGTAEERGAGNSQDSPGEMPKTGILVKIREFCLTLRRFFTRFMEALKNMEYTIRKICDKIKKMIGSIRYYMEVLQSGVFRSAWAVSKRQLLRILRMLRPETCRIHLLAGTGEPAGTGQVLAFYGILYPFIGNCVSVEADFEHRVVEGDLFIKGRITVFVFLVAALRLCMDRNIRRLWKMLKKEAV